MRFTNPDPNLQPRGKLTALPARTVVDNGLFKTVCNNHPNEYPVAAENFPKLAADIKQLLRRANLAEYSVIIVADNQNTPKNEGLTSDSNDGGRPFIRIGEWYLNNLSYKELMSVIAHESGHLAMDKYLPPIIKNQPNLTKTQNLELQADAYGALLTGDAQSAISAIQQLGHSYRYVANATHPSDAIRIQSLRTLPMEASPFRK
jgi:Zn-dependent protease with chaperone function